MKKGITIVFVMLNLLQHHSIIAQNLVPNGDFEFFTSCPSVALHSIDVSLAFPWVDPTNATSDYFNGCAPVSPCSVPDQTDGLWQYAHSGVGYAGILIQVFGANYREYIQVAFSDTLISGDCYCVTFYANLCNRIQLGVNNLGAYISNTAVTCTPPNPLGFTPQILLPGNPPIIDTVNWVKISGMYQAIGGEKYITIGNFNFDSATIIQIIDPLNPSNDPYYYIDDVSVTVMPSGNAGRDTTICHGDSIQLGSTNYENVTYSWQPTTGLSNANIGTPMASPATATTYYLTQTTPCATTVDTVVVSLLDCTEGINKLINNNEINLYPNPTTSSFTITTTGSKIKEVKVFNVLGSLLISHLSSGNTNETIDMSSVSKGIYFVQIMDEKLNVVNKKVVVQ